MRSRGRGYRSVVPADPTPQLTARETEVLALIAAGLSNREIADELFLSVNSVKTHIRTAYRKVGVSRRVDAIRWGVRHGLAGDSAPPAGLEPAT